MRLHSPRAKLTAALVPASRGAVTRRAAAGRGRGATATSALTATAADNRGRSAGRAAHAPAPDLCTPLDAARPADLSASVAARGCFITPRVRLASAGPSGARTQEDRIVGAIWPTEDAAPRSVSAAARRAREVMRQPLNASHNQDASRTTALATAPATTATAQGARA